MSLVFHPHIGASVMVQSGTVGGNTLGASTYRGTNIVLEAGSNLTIEVASQSRLVFHAAAGGTGGGGVGTDWAITGGSITVNTSGGTISLPAYLTTAQPPGAYLTTAAPPGAYLTTGAQSDHSHGALSLVNLTGTSASNGLTLSAAAPGGGGAIMVSAGSTSGNVQTLRFQDSGGIGFGLNGSTVTASHNGYTGATTQFLTTAQPPGAYLTTAMQSAEPHLRAIVYSNATQTSGTLVLSGSNGITIRSGAGTAIIEFDGHHLDALIPSGNGNGSGFSSMTSGTLGLNFAGGISGSQDGNNLTISAPTNYLTTAALSNHSHAFATTSTAGASIVVGTSGSQGVTIGVPAYLTTAQAPGAYLTTARASNDGVGLNTALTANGVAWTVNSSGLSLNVPAFLTTAAQVSHSHGNGSLALTNLTGTTASASNGWTISLSAAAPGGGAAQTFSAGTASGSANPIQFSNANGVTFGLGTGASSSVITASVNAGGGAAPGVRWACPRWVDASFVNLTNITGVTQRPLLFPFGCDGNLTGGELHWRMSRSTSGSNNFTVHVGIYSHVNATQISLFGSTSAAYSNTATASISGVRQFEMGVGTGLSTLSQGQWILGLIFSATATASMNYSLMGGATGNPGLGRIDQGSDQYVTYTSHFEMPFWGRYSTTTGGLPGSIAQSAVIGGLSGASLPMPMHFTLASHY